MERLDAAEERAQTEAREPFHSCGEAAQTIACARDRALSALAGPSEGSNTLPNKGLDMVGREPCHRDGAWPSGALLPSVPMRVGACGRKSGILPP